MALGLVRPLLGGSSWACIDIGKAVKATTLHAKARIKEMRGVVAPERKFMRYFTLITKYAH
jgi:hypothetical protein